MRENTAIQTKDSPEHSAYRAMLLAGGGSAVVGSGGHTSLQSFVETALTVHIPDDPSEAQVLRLIEHLTYSIAYFVAAMPERIKSSRLVGGLCYEFKPVFGICWHRPSRPDVVEAVIEGKSFLIPTHWLPADQQAQICQ